MNTRFSYMYRDEDNWKRGGEVIFAGETTPELEQRLLQSLNEEDFIADQVGVPEVFLWSAEADYDPDHPPEGEDAPTEGSYVINESDHCWHEYTGCESTEDAPTDPRTIAEFVASIEAAAKAGWQTFAPADRAPADVRVRLSAGA